MNSYNDPIWFHNPFNNQHSHLIPTREMLFQPRQQSHHIFYDYKHKPRQSPEMNYSTNNRPASFDYDQYRSQSSIVYPLEQTININRIHVNPQLSSEVDIVDDESMAEVSSDSGVFIERYSDHSLSKSRSSSPSSRRVVIKSNDRLVITSNKPRRKRRNPSQKTQREKLIYEKELISKKQSSFVFSRRQRSLSDRWEHKDDKLKRLFDEYSNENIHQDWKPLTLGECQELYQHAFDKYHGKSV